MGHIVDGQWAAKTLASIPIKLGAVTRHEPGTRSNLHLKGSLASVKSGEQGWKLEAHQRWPQ